MYLKYWGLSAQPFENVPDCQFFFGSMRHLEVLARLKYAFFGRRGGAMLTGEVGCGKTTVCRVLVSDLKKTNHKVALIENPSLSTMELLQEVVAHLGVAEPPQTKRQLLKAMHSQMLDGVRNQQETAIIIDEAQVIQRVSTFEELRLLLNFRLEEHHVVTLILVGQPELRQILPKMEQLNQRIAVRYHITPLDYEETCKYVEYRLERAGARNDIFDDGAMRNVYNYTKGIPRNINNFCDLCLLVAANTGKRLVEENLVAKLLEELKEA